MPLIIDPGLYMLNKSNVLLVRPNRSLPSAFKLFTGKYCSSNPGLKTYFTLFLLA